MDLLVWIATIAVATVFWCWVLLWGGAERLEGTFASGFLISWLAPRWTAEGIRFFALCALIVTAIGFVIGLLVPELRCGLTCA